MMKEIEKIFFKLPNKTLRHEDIGGVEVHFHVA
jgi:hypothetical protein